MVNNISSIPFKINTEVLYFILNNYKKFDLLIDPNYKHPLTIKDKLTKKDKAELESFLSKRDLEQNIIGLSYIYNNVPDFYFPIRLDFRGRLNCITDYLKYQSNELAKALLLFAKGEKVFLNDDISINYLKAFGASCFGNKLDKDFFDNRIK
jgi:DNA-directed RNA polymerase